MLRTNEGSVRILLCFSLLLDCESKILDLGLSIIKDGSLTLSSVELKGRISTDELYESKLSILLPICSRRLFLFLASGAFFFSVLEESFLIVPADLVSYL